MSEASGAASSRGQSHVVGVVLLLGITVLAIGGLSAVVGGIIDGQTAAADEARVASTFTSDLRPVEQTGHHQTTVRFSEGRLTTVERELRVLTDDGVQRTVPIGGLVFESQDTRVAFVGGSVVRGRVGTAWLERGPPVTSTADASAIVVGAPVLGDRGASVSGTGGTTARLRLNVTHRRASLPESTYEVGIETATPGPLRRHFEDRGLTTRTTDFDGDSVQSVVVSYPGRRQAYLVVHEMRLEVAHG